MTTCPKCKQTSGNSWSQCDGACPMPMSPHYMNPARTTAFIKGERWTHKTKGGDYTLIGLSAGAGISRAEQRVIYQSTGGQLYHRTTYDFVAQMERVG